MFHYCTERNMAEKAIRRCKGIWHDDLFPLLKSGRREACSIVVMLIKRQIGHWLSLVSCHTQIRQSCPELLCCRMGKKRSAELGSLINIALKPIHLGEYRPTYVALLLLLFLFVYLYTRTVLDQRNSHSTNSHNVHCARQ